MNVDTEIPIKNAVLYFGRSPDGYGGKAELARFLGITQSAIGRWAGPNVPPHHAKRLLRNCKVAAHLGRRKRATRKGRRNA